MDKTRLAEINTTIQELQQERKQLLKDEDAANEEHVRSLEWLKDGIGILHISSLQAAGLPRYRIHVGGKKTPKTPGPGGILVMGDSVHYQQNIMYSSDSRDGFPSFYTDSTELLIEFLKKAPFKNMEYSKDHLAVLEAARDFNNNLVKQW